MIDFMTKAHSHHQSPPLLLIGQLAITACFTRLCLTAAYSFNRLQPARSERYRNVSAAPLPPSIIIIIVIIIIIIASKVYSCYTLAVVPPVIEFHPSSITLRVSPLHYHLHTMTNLSSTPQARSIKEKVGAARAKIANHEATREAAQRFLK